MNNYIVQKNAEKCFIICFLNRVYIARVIDQLIPWPELNLSLWMYQTMIYYDFILMPNPFESGLQINIISIIILKFSSRNFNRYLISYASLPTGLGLSINIVVFPLGFFHKQLNKMVQLTIISFLIIGRQYFSTMHHNYTSTNKCLIMFCIGI